MRFGIALASAALLCSGAPSAAQPSAAPIIAAQKEAMAPLAKMDGIWRGTAWTLTRDGRHDVTHTERVGPFLGGSIKVVEGRAYQADGSIGFNAFGIISVDPATKAYTLHSYAGGHKGDFPLAVTADGYVWEISAGLGVKIRYTAKIGNGTWREIGERIAGEAPPMRIFEMNLKRVGDTSWPDGDPVPMR